MKNRILKHWKLAILAAGLPFLAASFQRPATIASQVDSTNTPVVSVEAPTADIVETTPALVPPLVDPKLSSGAVEVVKLAQSGVGQDVILTFIANATNHFSLGSDQIVYLNDLGIPDAMVKAMLQRDAALNDAFVPPAAPIEETVATETPTPAPPPAEVTEQALPPSPPDSSPDNSGSQDDSDYFFTELAPYGNWVSVSGYGRCWQPTVSTLNHNWQPYCDQGRWVLTDSGWYWQSDYSWGWAPFHYGRWYCDASAGWVWRPDNVWGPAWVSWRNSSDYCGWAPLPPTARFVPGVGIVRHNIGRDADVDFGLAASRYTFVPTKHFTDVQPGRYRVGAGQATQVYNRTTVINNITVNNNQVINRGIDPKQVALATHADIRKAQIQILPAASGRGDLANHVVSHPATPTVTSHPAVAAVSRPEPSIPQHTLEPIIQQGPNPPVAQHEPYPRGSLILSGRKQNTQVASAPEPRPLPNMNYQTYQAPAVEPVQVDPPVNAQNLQPNVLVHHFAPKPTTQSAPQAHFGRSHDRGNSPEPVAAPAHALPITRSIETPRQSFTPPVAVAPPVQRAEPVHHREPVAVTHAEPVVRAEPAPAPRAVAAESRAPASSPSSRSGSDHKNK